MAPPSPEAPWVPGHSLKSSKFLQALKNSHRKSLLPEAPFSLFLLCPFLGTLGILGINFSMSYLQTGPLWKSSLTPRVTVLYPFLSFRVIAIILTTSFLLGYSVSVRLDHQPPVGRGRSALPVALSPAHCLLCCTHSMHVYSGQAAQSRVTKHHTSQ